MALFSEFILIFITALLGTAGGFAIGTMILRKRRRKQNDKIVKELLKDYAVEHSKERPREDIYMH